MLNNVPDPKPASLGYPLAEIASAVAVPGVVLGYYFGVDFIAIWLSLCVVAAVALGARGKTQMNPVDWGVLLVTTYEIPSLLFSQYRANSTFFAWTMAVSALLYYFIRLTLRTPRQVVIVSGALAAFGAFLAWSAVSQFGANLERFQSAGFIEMVPFRSVLIHVPAPFVLGEWLTLLILLLPFAGVVIVYFWSTHRVLAVLSFAVPVALTAAMILSCSRAVFWSVVVFLVSLCSLALIYKLTRIRTALIATVSAIACVAILIVSAELIYPGVLDAYAKRDVSQVRSMAGRVSIWKRSRALFEAHPLWGVGSANAALFLTSTSTDDDSGFASRTFSLPVQVLAEKGAVGASCYLALLVLLTMQFHRRMRSSVVESWRKLAAACFASGIAAAVFRDLTYSSLLEHAPTTLLLVTLIAMLSSDAWWIICESGQ